MRRQLVKTLPSCLNSGWGEVKGSSGEEYHGGRRGFFLTLEADLKLLEEVESFTREL